ncbi:transcriptional regulator [Malikia spinosa]|uniref:helix-turn-helix domain-containing transcriptional regulator n=1 Tax=Malikia spinosa TaxID=86180 RepID=UPI003144F00D
MTKIYDKTYFLASVQNTYSQESPKSAAGTYLSLVLEDGDPALLVVTLGDIARARNMTQLARSPMDSRKRSTKRIQWRAGDGSACSK